MTNVLGKIMGTFWDFFIFFPKLWANNLPNLRDKWENILTIFPVWVVILKPQAYSHNIKTTLLSTDPVKSCLILE